METDVEGKEGKAYIGNRIRRSGRSKEREEGERERLRRGRPKERKVKNGERKQRKENEKRYTGMT